MSSEAKFNAAVKVIKNLPKNGSYTPSNDMMLKFYSFYKQATEGPCSLPKPSYWEPIKKAKWNAWNNLGKMTKEIAMDNYVDELKKIIETMSFSEPVAEFMDVLGPFYEVAEIKSTDDNSGDETSEKLENQPVSDIFNGVVGNHVDFKFNETSQDENSNQRVSLSEESDLEEYADSCDQLLSNKFNSNGDIGQVVSPQLCNEIAQVDGSTEKLIISELSLNNESVSVIKHDSNGSVQHNCAYSPNIQPLVNGRTGGAQKEQKTEQLNHGINGLISSLESTKSIDSPKSNISSKRGGDQDKRNPNHCFDSQLPQSDINFQVAMAVMKLQNDLQEVLQRVHSAEEDISHLKNKPPKTSSHSTLRTSSWWPLPPNWPVKSVLFVFMWPVIVHWVLTFLKVRWSSRRKS